MKRLFLSQPMRGKSDKEIRAEREKATQEASRAVDDTVVIIDSFFDNYDGNAVQFLGKSIEKLGEADIAYFVPGWREARGCVIENQVCKAYDIPVIES